MIQAPESLCWAPNFRSRASYVTFWTSVPSSPKSYLTHEGCESYARRSAQSAQWCLRTSLAVVVFVIRKVHVVLIAPVDSKSWFPTCGAQTPGQRGLDKWYDLDVFTLLLFIGVQLACNIVSVSGIQQSDSVYVYMYSLPGKPVCKYGPPW